MDGVGSPTGEPCEEGGRGNRTGVPYRTAAARLAADTLRRCPIRDVGPNATGASHA